MVLSEAALATAPAVAEDEGEATAAHEAERAMSSKKQKRAGKGRRKPTFPAKFSAGTQVRVKPGTTDPDFPDIPLGGWAQTIRASCLRQALQAGRLATRTHVVSNSIPTAERRAYFFSAVAPLPR